MTGLEEMRHRTQQSYQMTRISQSFLMNLLLRQLSQRKQTCIASNYPMHFYKRSKLCYSIC